MNGPLARWVHRAAEASGIAALVAHFHRHGRQEGEASRLGKMLYRARHSRAYPLAVALLAAVSAATGLYPYGPVIIAAVVFAPERWRSSYLAACVGAALGGMVTALLVETLGLGLVDSVFPGARAHEFWERSAYWIEQHGPLALAAIAALPLPQMPALLVSALGDLNPLAIGAALFAGKLVKYGAYILATRVVLAALHRVGEMVDPS
ncbi:MAG: hypothetical protein KA603_04270 [Azonexus sp.]|nr:hypothetical protein [Betaproteobacteria bacterium]MBK8918115.1 hypothetical protein [Betaproteobacteria bacterium]MBP6035332.1 hypothetical protein [Azonexus sp.]MBP6906093.1 hypothetical protein [Azonexus sp.]